MVQIEAIPLTSASSALQIWTHPQDSLRLYTTVFGPKIPKLSLICFIRIDQIPKLSLIFWFYFIHINPQ